MNSNTKINTGLSVGLGAEGKRDNALNKLIEQHREEAVFSNWAFYHSNLTNCFCSCYARTICGHCVNDLQFSSSRHALFLRRK